MQINLYSCYTLKEAELCLLFLRYQFSFKLLLHNKQRSYDLYNQKKTPPEGGVFPEQSCVNTLNFTVNKFWIRFHSAL